MSHLVPEVILDGAGMQALPVPFKGGGPAAQAVAGGHVAVVASSLPVAKPQVEGKLIKGMFVTSPKRMPALPDVPSLKELGYKFADVDLEFWWGLFVPKGTPEPIRARLEKALQATMANPAVRERLAKVDTDPSFAPAPALGSSSRTRSPTGRSSSTPRASRSSSSRTARSLPALAGSGKRVQASGVSNASNSPSTAVRFASTPTAASPLLSVLRDELGLRGAKFGCGTEQCGACMVLIDGEPAYSCTREVGTLTGKAVTTIEGLSRDGALSPLQQAFLDEQAGQCGYCLSGILIAATALLKKKPKPSRADIVEALDPHLCRCGIHNRVVRAVQKRADGCNAGTRP